MNFQEITELSDRYAIVQFPGCEEFAGIEILERDYPSEKILTFRFAFPLAIGEDRARVERLMQGLVESNECDARHRARYGDCPHCYPQ